jgi:cytochrome c heme-lyase
MGQCASAANASPASKPEAAETMSSGGCPVRQGKPSQVTASQAQGTCPVRGAAPSASGIDPQNMMPVQPNQMPAEGQVLALSTDRVESSIPQADGTTRWVYPSAQMFYNALRRKGKTTGEEEEHMDAVIAIHNNMNERTWNEVLEWERMHCKECERPTLARFMGRPDELSVEAQLRYWLTGQLPFDRHDWFVNRCGREVRYIIDYYDVPEKHDADKIPKLHDNTSVKSIELSVRPALDSFEAASDRTRRALQESLRGVLPAPAASSGASATTPSAPTSDAPSMTMSALRDACSDRVAAMQNCDGEEACEKAHIGLILCMAEKVCKGEASRFKTLFDAEVPGPQTAKAFAEMQDCLSKYAAVAKRTKSKP